MLVRGLGAWPAVSPDGMHIVFPAAMRAEKAACSCGRSTRSMPRPFRPRKARRLPFFWSPDGRQIAFIAEQPAQESRPLRRAARRSCPPTWRSTSAGQLEPRRHDHLFALQRRAFSRCPPTGGDSEAPWETCRGRTRSLLAAVPAGRTALSVPLGGSAPGETRGSTSRPRFGRPQADSGHRLQRGLRLARHPALRERRRARGPAIRHRQTRALRGASGCGRAARARRDRRRLRGRPHPAGRVRRVVHRGAGLASKRRGLDHVAHLVRQDGEGAGDGGRARQLLQSSPFSGRAQAGRGRARHGEAARHLGLRPRSRGPDPADVRSRRRHGRRLAPRRHADRIYLDAPGTPRPLPEARQRIGGRRGAAGVQGRAGELRALVGRRQVARPQLEARGAS